MQRWRIVVSYRLPRRRRSGRKRRTPTFTTAKTVTPLNGQRKAESLGKSDRVGLASPPHGDGEDKSKNRGAEGAGGRTGHRESMSCLNRLWLGRYDFGLWCKSYPPNRTRSLFCKSYPPRNRKALRNSLLPKALWSGDDRDRTGNP